MLRYDKMVEAALRGVVRQALSEVAEHGFPPGHHFYVTFQPAHPGVDMPDYLRERHPEEMTIVLQHQYWGLEVEDDFFSVTLSFNKVHERLTVPFDAVTGFVDPPVKFGLHFQVSPEMAEALAAEVEEQEAEEEAEKETEDRKTGEVVALDAFRKK